ncbi:hypothetical protein CI109_100724 [Kwoniella shandongensis]|uniref:Aldose 1-epimerase n=1 Tax=Kwoniella shandongensis TaxID=1734106 RepID=A0A5M6BN09_9TREE|nr:uncharacterized protein CI109_007391 [Kwoniella shandongensis]KAA5524268.1 hypothetical protein CI109_007391 [Kwoniella shandongensis]
MSNNVIGSFEGEDVLEVHLKKAGIEASIGTFGASIRDLQVDAPEGKRRVIVGFPKFEDQLANKSWHWGAVPGRVANRIAHGKFTLDDKQHQIVLNENNTHVCHGGTSGFGVRNWTILEQSSDSVTLGLESKDGDQGFPGNLSAKVTYTLTNDHTLAIDWSATSDAPTLVNLTTHAFFNLNGTSGENTSTHKLLFEADHYTPVDDGLIPTGEIASVENTPFDFRTLRTIGDTFHVDHNYVLRNHTGQLRRGAELVSSKGDLMMEAWTDQPGIQFFDGKPLAISQPGHDGMRIDSRAGLCLEPQVHPDAINHDNFPNTVLRPGEEYKHRSEFRFRKA